MSNKYFYYKYTRYKMRLKKNKNVTVCKLDIQDCVSVCRKNMRIAGFAYKRFCIFARHRGSLFHLFVHIFWYFFLWLVIYWHKRNTTQKKKYNCFPDLVDSHPVTYSSTTPLYFSLCSNFVHPVSPLPHTHSKMFVRGL